MKTSNNLKILVAEDNGVYRKLLSAMIEKITGKLPESVSNGEEALHLSRKEGFDLIFMDNHMPILGGILATQKIRESFPVKHQPYIVAVTGTSDSRELNSFKSAGMNDLLSKPFGLAELAESIEKAIMAKAATQQPIY